MQAVDEFLTPLRQAISCITLNQLQVSRDGWKELDKKHTLSLNRGEPVLLNAERGRIGFSAVMLYKIVKSGEYLPYDVTTCLYKYQVERNDGTEVLLFHWHPSGPSPVETPHIHVGNAVLQPDGVLIADDHIPSGRISLEAVIRFCIRDLGVRPRRADWDQVLSDCEDLFKMRRKWR